MAMMCAGERKSRIDTQIGGFTLLETILAMALSAMVIGLLYSFSWNMFVGREKTTTVRAVINNSRILSERLKKELRQAHSVDYDQSVFGDSSGQLVFSGEDGLTTIFFQDDKVSIQRPGGDRDFLHPDNIRIRDFIFDCQRSLDGEIQFVGFSYTAEAYYPNAGQKAEYNYSLAAKGGVEIRSW